MFACERMQDTKISKALHTPDINLVYEYTVHNETEKLHQQMPVAGCIPNCIKNFACYSGICILTSGFVHFKRVV